MFSYCDYDLETRHGAVDRILSDGNLAAVEMDSEEGSRDQEEPTYGEVQPEDELIRSHGREDPERDTRSSEVTDLLTMMRKPMVAAAEREERKCCIEPWP